MKKHNGHRFTESANVPVAAMTRFDVEAAVEMHNERLDHDALKIIMLTGAIRYAARGFDVRVDGGTVHIRTTPTQLEATFEPVFLQ